MGNLLNNLDEQNRQEWLDAIAQEDYTKIQALLDNVDPSRRNLYSRIADTLKAISELEDTLYSRYERHAGETEARNTETRLTLSENKRKSTPLDATEDIPRDRQIIGKLMAKQIRMARAKFQAEQYHQPTISLNDMEKSLGIAQAQLNDVREQYEGTDLWMKAPNGRITNLTEKQWLQVRTPNFKACFGDREFEPLVVYHGTRYGGFSQFRTNDTGAYFTSNRTTGATYSAGEISIVGDEYDRNDFYATFLNLRNQFIVDAKGNYWIDIYVNPSYPHMYTDELARLVRKGEIGDGHHDGVIVQNVMDVFNGGSEIFDENGNYLKLDDEGMRKRFLGDNFMVFKPENIKSAVKDNGNFNPNDPDIYHQSLQVNMGYTKYGVH